MARSEALRAAQRRYRHTEAGRAARARERAARRQTEAGRAERVQWKRSLTGKRMLRHSFVGVDGEGWSDANGRHHYMTLSAGNADGAETLYTGKPLTSIDCLKWITSLPVERNLYYVAFFFDYDVTMILRDMALDDPELARSLFLPNKNGSYVWWNGYGIEYRPKKHLKVKRWTPDNSSKAVTIHDVQGFYQCSFVQALHKFGVGTPEERERIAAMKLLRGSFTAAVAREVIAYSEEECALLVRLVEALRDATHHAKLNAAPYEGPGDMARRALEQKYGKRRHAATREAVPDAVRRMAAKAYYGGRFEVMAHGPIAVPVYEYDIKSAYPTAMRDLPCLWHGTWTRGVSSPLYIAEVDFHYPDPEPGAAMPFPIRRRDGSIYFPTSGRGWYWSHEIEAAPRDGLDIRHAWSFHSKCVCKPFAWVNDYYEERLLMEAAHPGSGIALKLMLNTLYGKLAQQRPYEGSFFDIVLASLITSTVRARVYNVCRLGVPVVMIATDAVFTLESVPSLDVGPKLGQWELGNDGKPYRDLAIFQPGVYFDGLSAAYKTRGIPKQIFRDNARALRDMSQDFSRSYPVTIQTHLSLRLALSRGTPQAMRGLGNWTDVTKNMNAHPGRKRDPDLYRRDGAAWSKPLEEYARTVPYSRGLSLATYDNLRLDDDEISDGYYEGDF